MRTVRFGLMSNRFYNRFDCETLESKNISDYRSAFQIDRDRIIYSNSFRRLQSKTQVFLSGEYDFYRTRLTHSIEVAQIGRSICRYLQTLGDPLGEDFFVDPDLVEAVCLTHDLGHPPFGHSGERALHELMREHGGFEGNAQTLRIITEAIYQDDSGCRGMKPTRAFLDGVLKYKKLHGELVDPDNHFLYDEQERYRDFVFASREIPVDWSDGEDLNRLKSIECQVMDWADDTAYSLNDIVDGVRAGFLTTEKIRKWSRTAALNASAEKAVAELLNAIAEDRLESVFSRKIGRFIQAVSIGKTENFLSDLTNRYRFALKVDPAVAGEAEIYKKLAFEVIFRSPQLQQIEHKGAFVLKQLFHALRENYIEPGGHRIRFLPVSAATLVDGETEVRAKTRRLSDYLASMTDSAAIRTYKRLFDPDFGSITEIT